MWNCCGLHINDVQSGAIPLRMWPIGHAQKENVMNKPVITAAMMEEYIAKKAADDKAAKAKAKANKAKPGDGADRRTSKDVQKEYPNLALHYCTVTGGRKFDIGTHVECHWVGRNKFRQDTARIFDKSGKPIMIDGKDRGWIAPNFLKTYKELPKERVAAIEAMRTEDSDETILVPASVLKENVGKSVLLSYSGWMGPSWFPASMVEKVGETETGLGIFDVPAWKVRKDKGPDALEHLRTKQEHLQALVDQAEQEVAKPKKAGKKSETLDEEIPF